VCCFAQTAEGQLTSCFVSVVVPCCLRQEDLTHEYEHKLLKLEARNRTLDEENQSLLDVLSRTQASLDTERDSLKKAVSDLRFFQFCFAFFGMFVPKLSLCALVVQLKIIEQFKKRSRDYLEMQKKTQQILVSPEGLHYTMYLDHSVSAAQKNSLLNK
jgi:hypothetical protein